MKSGPCVTVVQDLICTKSVSAADCSCSASTAKTVCLAKNLTPVSSNSNALLGVEVVLSVRA